MPFQPAAPTLAIPGFEGCLALVPCHGETVSGDAVFEEVGRIDGRHLFLLLDVAGHGPPAAEIVSFVFEQLRADPIYLALGPGQLLARLHELLEPMFPATYRFVAALAVLVDGANGWLVGGSAGQPLPRIGRVGGAWAVWWIPGGAPLGCFLLVRCTIKERLPCPRGSISSRSATV
jgi:hypothetical protein